MTLEENIQVIKDIGSLMFQSKIIGSSAFIRTSCPGGILKIKMTVEKLIDASLIDGLKIKENNDMLKLTPTGKLLKPNPDMRRKPIEKEIDLFRHMFNKPIHVDVMTRTQAKICLFVNPIEVKMKLLTLMVDGYLKKADLLITGNYTILYTIYEDQDRLQ